MVKVTVKPSKPAENAAPTAPASAPPAQPASPAAQVPEPAATPVITDPRAREDLEHEQFLQSPVTRAVLSGYACSNCGTPVDKRWTHCPVCGSEEAKKRANYDYPGLDEVVEKFHKPKDPGPAKS
jgi:hypothetical protein